MNRDVLCYVCPSRGREGRAVMTPLPHSLWPLTLGVQWSCWESMMYTGVHRSITLYMCPRVSPFTRISWSTSWVLLFCMWAHFNMQPNAHKSLLTHGYRHAGCIYLWKDSVSLTFAVPLYLQSKQLHSSSHWEIVSDPEIKAMIKIVYMGFFFPFQRLVCTFILMFTFVGVGQIASAA